MEQLDKQEQQEAFISHLIKNPPLSMYNIGVGPKSEYKTLKAIYPDMALFGCEPLALMYDGLHDKFPGKLLTVALGAEKGHAQIHYNRNGLMQATMLGEKRSESTEVVVTTLDIFDEMFLCPDRILLWADIEGMEYPMLQGGSEVLASGRVRWINLEEHIRDEENIKKINAFLADFGYDRVQEYNKHPHHQDVIYIHKDEKRV